MGEASTISFAPTVLRLAETDAQMPVHWRSGSLKYEQFEPLGEGGVATVERCWDQNLRRYVAIKRLHPEYRDDEVLSQRFLREARVTALIPHPGTVPIYEIGRDREGALFFTMKLLEGRDLRSILTSLEEQDEQVKTNYPLSRLIDILIQCGQTIEFAHQQGVIHRDLKPANIQVGAFGEVTVLDWGLAKVNDEPDMPEDLLPTSRERHGAALTKPGNRCGTPMYMSPEQASGSLKIDARTDVYSLGTILYEVLSGQLPASGNSAEQYAQDIIHGQIEPPSAMAHNRWVPPELEAICMRALEKDREARYPSVQAMLTDLVAYRSRQLVSAYPYSQIDRIKRWRKKNIARSACLLGFIGGLAAGLTLIRFVF